MIVATNGSHNDDKWYDITLIKKEYEKPYDYIGTTKMKTLWRSEILIYFLAASSSFAIK